MRCGAWCCASGKVYYDLLSERRATRINDVAIVRLEQLLSVPRAGWAACWRPTQCRRRVVPGRAGDMGAWQFRRPPPRKGAEPAGQPGARPTIGAARRRRARRPGRRGARRSSDRWWRRRWGSGEERSGSRAEETNRLATEIKVPALGESVTRPPSRAGSSMRATRSPRTSRWWNWRPTRSRWR